MNKYFEVKLSYNSTDENGKDIKAKERVVFCDAETFGGAEETAYSYFEDYSGIDVNSIKTIKAYKPLIISEDEDAKWYIAIVKMLGVVDEDSGKVQTIKNNHLIKADKPEDVISYLNSDYKDAIFGFSIVSVKESGIDNIVLPIEQ